MKQRIFSAIAFVLIAISGMAQTADRLFVDNFSIKQNEQMTIAVQLENPGNEYCAFQFDLQLPKGVTIVSNGEKQLGVSLNANRKKSTHNLSAEMIAEGCYRFVCFSMSNDAFSGHSGALVDIQVKADASLVAGTTMSASVENVVLTKANGDDLKIGKVPFDIVVPAPIGKYTLTYVVDGQTYMTCEVEAGTAVTAIAEPTKKGHSFSGWSGVPSTMPENDVTITGTFTVNTYTITYLLDGETYRKVQLAYGAAIVTPDVPAKEGYSFSGWSGVPSTMPEHDVTITGTFTVNTYTITYLLDGETYRTTQLAYGSAIVTPSVPVKEGHLFEGWSDVPATMPAQDLTITGSYKVLTYNLIFMLDGEIYQSVSMACGTKVTIVPEVPAKEGYTFGGWGYIPAVMLARDVYVYGEYIRNSYNLIYMVDGVEYRRYSIYYGASIQIAPAAPTKEGYTFSGWSEVPKKMPDHDVIVHGSFMVDGIETLTTDKVVDVYTLQGVLIKSQIRVTELEKELPHDIYIIEGKKVVIP